MSNSADSSSADLETNSVDESDEVLDLTEEVDGEAASVEVAESGDEDLDELKYDRTAEVPAVDVEEESAGAATADMKEVGRETDELDMQPDHDLQEDAPETGASVETSKADGEAGRRPEIPSAAIVTPRVGHHAVERGGEEPDEDQRETEPRPEPDPEADSFDPRATAPAESVPSVDADESSSQEPPSPESPSAEPERQDEVLKTIQMEAIDRQAIEREGQYGQLEQTLPLLSSRFAPEIVVDPPQLLVGRWHEGLPEGIGVPSSESKPEPEPEGMAEESQPPPTPTGPKTAPRDVPSPSKDSKVKSDAASSGGPKGGSGPRSQTSPPEKWRPPNNKDEGKPSEGESTSSQGGGRTRKRTPNGPPGRSTSGGHPAASGPPPMKPGNSGPREPVSGNTEPRPQAPATPSGPRNEPPGGSGPRKKPPEDFRPGPQTPGGQKSPPPPTPEVDDQQELDNLVEEIIDGEEEPAGLVEASDRREFDDWVQKVFGENYLMTLPQGIHSRTVKEADFIEKSLSPKSGDRLLDLACGWGRHTLELAKRGYPIVGFDLSEALLRKALAEAKRQSLNVNFFHGDMRTMDFENVFDHVLFWETSFGYFGERTNRKVLERIHRSLRPGGQLLLDVTNRDFAVRDMPHRIWWEGSDCIFLEEGEFDFQSSVFHLNRSFIFEDGRPPIEHDYYIRLYAPHELRSMIKQAGFEVTQVSGAIQYPGYFLGPESPRIILRARKSS